jgi:hypothetical protein
MSEGGAAGDSGGQQAAGCGKKLPPANRAILTGGVFALLLQVRHLGERRTGVSTMDSAALYDDVTVKQSLKIVFLTDS